jgi:hypothetical protein
MQYVLTFYLDEAGWPKLTKAELDQEWRPTMPTMRYLECGRVEGHGPPPAKLDRDDCARREWKSQELDCPFADSKERLVGHYIALCADMTTVTFES